MSLLKLSVAPPLPSLLPLSLPYLPMPRQTVPRSTSHKVKMTVMGLNGPRTTTAGLLRIRQDWLDTEQELDMQAQGIVFVVFSDNCSHFMPIARRAAILPVEAALEVGIRPTFHHDTEDLMIPYLDHSEPAHNDSRWSSEDSSSSSDEEIQATPALSRPSTNVYSAYLQLQQWMQ